MEAGRSEGRANDGEQNDTGRPARPRSAAPVGRASAGRRDVDGVDRNDGTNHNATAEDTSATSTHTPSSVWAVRSPHKPLRTVLGLLAFALVLHVFVLPLLSNFGDTWNTLSSLDPTLFFLAVLVEGAAWWCSGESARILVPRDTRPSKGLFYAVTLASNGLSRLIPGGAVSTAGIAFVLLRKARVPDGRIGYAYATSGIMTVLTLNGLLAIAVIIGLFQLSEFHSYVAAGVVSVAIVVAIVGGIGMMVRRTDDTARLIGRIVGWIPKVDVGSVEAWVCDTASRMADLTQDRSRLVRLVLLSGGRWLGEVASLWVVFAALDAKLDPLVAIVAIALANLVGVIPISPGGLGIFEATMIGVIVAFGTDHTTATAGVMAFRGISFWLMIPAGAIANFAANWAIDHGRGVPAST